MRDTTGNGRSAGRATPHLVVVGGISSDRLRLPNREVTDSLGGAGLFAGLGAAATGARVTLAGVVSDDIGSRELDEVRARMDLSRVSRFPGARLRFEIAYDSRWHARYAVDSAEAEKLLDAGTVTGVAGADGFHVCPLGPPNAQLAIARAVREAKSSSVLLSATTFRNRITRDPATAATVGELVDVLVCNAEEALLLTMAGALPQALRRFRESLATRAAGQAVCVTDGSRGVWLVTRSGARRVGAYPTRVVDPTGAGEAFAGATMATYLAGVELPQAVAVGAAVASLAVEGIGPRALLAARPEEVQRRAAVLANEQAGESGARDA